MCGACPGGGRLSEETLFLAQRVPPARTARTLSELTGGRLRIEALGDGWSVGFPTGGLMVAGSFEELVRFCAPYADAARTAAAREAIADAPDEAVEFVLHRLECARADGPPHL